MSTCIVKQVFQRRKSDMNYYVSDKTVATSIDYFKNAGYSNDILMLFLLNKHMGVTTNFPIKYSEMSSDQKKDFLTTLWMLGGIFDSTESCGKNGLIFPTGFSNSKMYNAGTEFSKEISRVSDTIKQLVNTIPIFKYNHKVITLSNNYKDVIKEKCLNGNKISLSNLAAWVFRYTSFDFEDCPDEKQFTRVVEKAIKKLFKINKNDFLWLFEDDFAINRLMPAKTGISGKDVRSYFTYKEGKTPEIQSKVSSDDYQESAVNRDLVERYLALNGENPSDEDIFDILKSKKQIVLTGVPGVGKSRYTQKLCENPFFSHSKTIQFHASYSYEDFIGSEILKSNSDGTYVTTRKGVFLDFANIAEKNPDENYLFVIDELNRGNIAEIFGEAILALDRNYTANLSREYDGVDTLKIPKNLYIVATMNTSDRNIAFLDLAIRRRFAFVPLFPNYDFLSEKVFLDGFDLGNVLKTINQRIVNVLNDTELMLGQSYFIPNKKDEGYVWNFEQFKNQFNFVLLPTIREYSFNNPASVNSILGENLGDGIQETDDFKIAFTEEFSIMR